MEYADFSCTGKRHHSNLFQWFYEPPTCIRVVLANSVKSARKVRWDICPMRPRNTFVQYWNTPATQAVPQWGISRPEHSSCGSKSGCSMANASQLVGLGLHFDSGSRPIKRSVAQDGFIDIGRVRYSVDRVSLRIVLTDSLTGLDWFHIPYLSVSTKCTSPLQFPPWNGHGQPGIPLVGDISHHKLHWLIACSLCLNHEELPHLWSEPTSFWSRFAGKSTYSCKPAYRPMLRFSFMILNKSSGSNAAREFGNFGKCTLWFKLWTIEIPGTFAITKDRQLLLLYVTYASPFVWHQLTPFIFVAKANCLKSSSTARGCRRGWPTAFLSDWTTPVRTSMNPSCAC